MNEIERIQELMRRAFYGPAWHADSLAEILAGVTAEQAARRPGGASHSIWEILLHVIAWEDIVRHRLSGPYEVKINSEEDWPPIPATSPENWSAALERLQQAHSALIEATGVFPEDKLSSNVPGGDPSQQVSYYILLHGAVDHTIYHSAQIAVLKRMVAE